MVQLLSLTFTLLLLLTWAEVDGKENCANVKCETPPKGPASKGCVIVPESDRSLPRPTGPLAKCCPLYKCGKGDGKFYTVHGIKMNSAGKGGKEVVNYSSSKKGSVSSSSSSATGDHDAFANVGDAADIDEALAQIQEALGDF